MTSLPRKSTVLTELTAPELPPAGMRFACQRCTNCCRWPGFVAITAADISKISTFLKLSEGEFIEHFTRLRANRDGLALTEQPDGACIFLDGRDCSIQPVKPMQCSGFPNTWNFPGWRDVCEAIPVPVGEGAE